MLLYVHRNRKAHLVIRYEKPRTATTTFTQLLNSDLCSDCTPGYLSYSLRCVECKGGSYACSCWQSSCEHGGRQVSMSHVFLETFLFPLELLPRLIICHLKDKLL